ncbi:MAG: M56 family metallopeptidase [Lachnospiraceae bacterium]|nr:M56 family metallopeptidase [Lachnospiraceae bacterium]
MEQLIYFIGTLSVVDITVIVAGIVPVLTGGRVGYRWRKMLWLVLAVRLLIPVRLVLNQICEEKPSYFAQVELPESYAAVPGQEDAGGKEMPVTKSVQSAEKEFIEKMEVETKNAEERTVEEKADADGAVIETTMQRQNTDQVVKDSRLLDSLYDDRWLILVVWILVGFALTEYHVIGFVRIKELINMRSRRCEDPYLCSLVREICEEYQIKSAPQILFCEEIRSPMLLGYRHTQLLMPDRPYTETDLNMIVRHELQHKKNGDLWYKLLILFVCDIYWFNPAMAIMRKLACQDVECVCDSQVLRRLPAEERKAYGNIVLSHMVKGSKWDIVYGTSIFTGKRAAKRRIRNMFAMKNKWGYAVLGVMVLCVAWGSSMWVLSGQEENAGNASESEL